MEKKYHISLYAPDSIAEKQTKTLERTLKESGLSEMVDIDTIPKDNSENYPDPNSSHMGVFRYAKDNSDSNCRREQVVYIIKVAPSEFSRYALIISQQILNNYREMHNSNKKNRQH